MTPESLAARLAELHHDTLANESPNMAPWTRLTPREQVRRRTAMRTVLDALVLDGGRLPTPGHEAPPPAVTVPRPARPADPFRPPA